MTDTRDHILIIKLGALGDIVQAFGAMQAIRAHHPGARMTALTAKPYAALLQQSGLFDAVWIDQKPKWHQLSRWIALRQKLNTGHFTRVYDLQNNDRTALYFRLMNPKPEWVGTAKGASHENNDPSRTTGHAFEGHKQTLARAGIHAVQVDTLNWMTGRADLALPPKPYVLIAPGASAKRPLKRWPAEYYAALCQQCVAIGFHPILIGSAQEKDIAAEIRKHCPKAIDMTGKTQMTDLPALARGATFAVGNDTGPMHLIAQTGCASLVLFSNDSNPVKHKPLGARVITLQENDLRALVPTRVWDELTSKKWVDA